MSRPRLAAQGLSVGPPPGWEASIYRRPPSAGEQTFAVLHAATVPLPPTRGDYGGGLVETLGTEDVFVSLLDFGPAAAGSELFGARGLPGLTPDMFRPKQLQRVLRGQAGVQRFFSESGRAFCLYAVIGSYANRLALCSRANQVIGSIRVEALPAGTAG
ncbi:MAG TPA: hypothetical protein VG184_02305 [Acidimicrobiales bacterium]|jgi:hypothetical protein|nr:hypothetical protein [Acidimicrobiales bacterium]